MQLGEIIALVVVILIVTSASAYIIISKKRGNKCIGCPHGKTCKGHCSEKKNV